MGDETVKNVRKLQIQQIFAMRFFITRICTLNKMGNTKGHIHKKIQTCTTI
jgi:hypothetical protein